MNATFRMLIAPIPGKIYTKQYFFGVRCEPADARKCAAALADIGCSDLKWIAKRLAEPSYYGTELYVVQLDAWPRGIARFGPDHLAQALLAAGIVQEAA